MTPLTIEQAMQIAIGHHQNGRLAEAETIYRQVLARFSDHAEALHLLGVLASQRGQMDRAIELIGRAIAVDPAVALYHCNLGEICRRSGQPDRAIAHFYRATELKPGAADAHNNLGTVLWEKGRLEEALAAYRRAIELKPDHVEAHSNLGVVLNQQGRLNDAIAAYSRALQLRPDHAEVHSNLGDALKDQGRLEEAIGTYRRAIQLRPDLAQTHNNLGNALKDLGRLDEAIAAYRRAIQLRPGNAAAHSNLGIALKNQGRLDEAIAAYQRAIELEPDLVEAQNNLGNALRDLGRLDEAIAAYQRAIRSRPGYAAAYNNLGSALKEQGRLEEAIAAHRRAIALKPDMADAYCNLGVVLKEQGRLDDAIAAYMRAIELEPDHAEALNNLGNVLKDQGRLEEAIDAYQRAIRSSPGYAMAQSNLGCALMDQGRLDEAIASFHEAMAIKPLSPTSASNFLFYLHFHPNYDAQALLAEHRLWARRYAEPLAAESRRHENDRSPDRKLRVGYVSPDFRHHPVGRSVLPLLANHNRREFEIICYADVRVPDELTTSLKPLADQWRETAGLSDSRLSDLIRTDRIDILVDCALHTAGNRMLVFARKPAPVQVSMLGMPSTTGLATIDYRVTDPYLDPPGAGDENYAEALIRLPHSFWCYQPPEETPPVNPTPALKHGSITFGCLNKIAKVTRPALELWLRILQAVPASRLVILSPPGGHLDALRALFAEGGVAHDRVEFVPSVSQAGYFARYHDLDLSLDPFPYNGHTSALDSLWMGVPVITLAGRTAVGRGGVSILSKVGLPELIAATPERYVAIAVDWARDLARLAELRAGLRERLRGSPLMDGFVYTADVEAAFRRIWKTWCGA
jgi:predicted O-linked N-acetylglucosamine transferase (SPINDLY family)